MDTGDGYEAAPNIDHTQEFVRKDLSEWMRHMRKVQYLEFVEYEASLLTVILLAARSRAMCTKETWWQEQARCFEIA